MCGKAFVQRNISQTMEFLTLQCCSNVHTCRLLQKLRMLQEMANDVPFFIQGPTGHTGAILTSFH